MIASTFWKNTMPLCTGCDQSTACSSSWWSAKLPGRVEELLRHDRRPQPDVGQREALARLADLAAPLEPLAGRGAVELDDDLALQATHPAGVERDQLHGDDSLSFYESYFRISSAGAAQCQGARVEGSAVPFDDGSSFGMRAPDVMACRRGCRTAARRSPRRSPARRA